MVSKSSDVLNKVSVECKLREGHDRRRGLVQLRTCNVAIQMRSIALCSRQNFSTFERISKEQAKSLREELCKIRAPDLGPQKSGAPRRAQGKKTEEEDKEGWRGSGLGMNMSQIWTVQNHLK